MADSFDLDALLELIEDEVSDVVKPRKRRWRWVFPFRRKPQPGAGRHYSN